MKKLVILLLLVCAPATAATYYVRTDGGTYTQCTGLADAAYPGSGTAQACAWAHPFWALPPKDSADPVRISGGDTLVIGPGQYMIGYGAPNTSACATAFPAECYMKAPPSGPSAGVPTRIVGKTWDTSCTNKPQLWGTERTFTVVNIDAVSNVTLACLEITDRAGCAANHIDPTYRCARSTYPFGQYADNGVMARQFSGTVTNVTMQDLDIHGISGNGFIGGNISGWTLTRVRIAANGFAGINADIGSTNHFPGTNTWSRVLIEWNGCVETYPSKRPVGCWSQDQGGYGDGVGTGRTGGDWNISDSVFRFNVSDGLDLLYHEGGGTITMTRVWAEGNAGNQLKTYGNATLTNSVVLGNCGFFAGKTFTVNSFNSVAFNNCRAGGDVLAFGLAAGDSATVINNTVVNGGNVSALLSGTATSSITFKNNVFVGMPFYLDQGRNGGDLYVIGSPTVVDQFNTKYNTHNVVNCASTGNICQSGVTNFGLTAASLTRLDPRLPSGSVHRNAGTTGAGIPSIDFYGNVRPALGGVDRGAVEAQQ